MQVRIFVLTVQVWCYIRYYRDVVHSHFLAGSNLLCWQVLATTSLTNAGIDRTWQKKKKILNTVERMCVASKLCSQFDQGKWNWSFELAGIRIIPCSSFPFQSIHLVRVSLSLSLTHSLVVVLDSSSILASPLPSLIILIVSSQLTPSKLWMVSFGGGENFPPLVQSTQWIVMP